MKKLIGFVAVALMVVATAAQGKVVTEMVEYKQGETVLEGMLAYDDAITEKRPAVIVVHEWMGLNDYAKMRAKMLAELGYVAFAADIYGKGVMASSPEEAGKLSGQYRSDRALTRARVNAAVDWVKGNTRVDPAKVAAIGYCFGGMVALELARSGADVKGVVSFHGVPDSPMPAAAGDVKAKVLVLHGAIDPYVPADAIKSFEKEMNDAKVDYQFIAFGGAVHGFSNPGGGDNVAGGYAYNERADKRSWQMMLNFFDEIFMK